MERTGWNAVDRASAREREDWAPEQLVRPGLSRASGGVANHGDWRFLMAPSKQLRVRFEVAPKPKTVMGQSPLPETPRIQG